MSYNESVLKGKQIVQNVGKMTDYELVVSELRKFIKSTNLTPESNHIVQLVKELNKDELQSVINEYAQFSNEAIHMLLDARIRDYDWEQLKNEIDRNIEEEKGSETKLVPHLEIMRRGYREELGIETDDNHVSKTTELFLAQMRKIFKHDDNAYSAGALLAFEGTAIPEFYILDEIVTEYTKKTGIEFKKGPTKSYIDGHKFFEIGHEDGLKTEIKPYINAENMENFVKGYVSVVLAMANWWESLAHDLEVSKMTFVTPYNGFKK
jgi:hypothetical protein